MSCVYLIRSIKYPEITYVGYTKNVDKRLQSHNFGQSKYSAKYKPWELIIAIQLVDDTRAKQFEKYLKTASGKAFLSKHFL